MKKLGRNAPCPCGSGKKYKRCCLAKDDEDRRRRQHRRDAVNIAVGWLLEHHGERADEEIAEGFFETLEYLAALEELPRYLRHAIENNSLEWLVAEGWLTVGKTRRSALSLVLEGVGPQLSADQRQWLDKMGQNAVGLYEVREVGPGASLRLQDLIEPERPLIELLDPALAEEVTAGTVFGARLLPEDDHWLRSPALYPFEAWRLEDIEYAVGEVRKENAEDPEFETDQYPWEFGNIVIGNWLIQSYDGIVDLAGPGSPLLVHRYRVDDWDRLAAALAEQPDVEGDRTRGWTRFELDDDPAAEEDEERSWLLALNPVADDRLDAVPLFADEADEEREWLDRLAGDAVAFLETAVLESPEAVMSEEYMELPPAAKNAEVQAVLEEGYRDWAREPIPFLSGKPPMLAVRTEEGRARVRYLLEKYEEAERDLASREGREPASHEFLWQAVGLDREPERIEAKS